MERIVVDDQTTPQFQGLASRAEIHDSRGQLLGMSVPLKIKAITPSQECPYTEEEIAAALADPQRFTLAEILAELARH